MPTSLDTIRTITVKSTAEGVAETTAQLKQLSAANENLAVASDKTTKSQLSVQSALDRQQRSLDTAYRSSQQYTKVVSDLERAHAQGLTSLDRHNQLMGLAAEKYGQGSAASKAFAAATSQALAPVVALAAGAGPLGVFLSGLGPYGIAAAVGIGAVEKAFGMASAAAHEFAQKSRELKDFAESTGLTINQLKALEQVGSNVGVSSDRVAQGIEGMTSRLDEFRNGQGKAFDLLYKYNSGLALQVAAAKGTTAQIDLLTKAFANLDTTQSNALGRSLGLGRAPGDLIRTLTAVGNQGGMAGIAQAASDAGKSIDENLVKRIADLDIQIDQATKHMKNSFVSIFAEDVLSAELKFYKTLDDILKAIGGFRMPSDFTTLLSALRFLNPVSAIGSAIGGAVGNAVVGKPMGGGDPFGGGWGRVPGLDAGGPGRTLYDQPIGPAPGLNAEAQYNIINRGASILGAAATSSEKLALETAKLNAENEKLGGSYDALAKRALEYFKVQQSGADLQIKVQAGVATAEDLAAQKQKELALQVRMGKLTWDEIAQGAQGYKKQLELTIQQQEIFKAALPGLKQLELSAGSLRGQLDTLGTQGLGDLNNALLDFQTGAKNGSDAIKAFEQAFLKSLLNMMNQMLIVMPIAKALQQLMSSLGGFGLNLGGGGGSPGKTLEAKGDAFYRGNVIPFARGGIVDRPTLFAMANGMGLMGEAGPEAVVPLRRGADGRLGVASSSGGASPQFNLTVENHGGQSEVQQQRNSSGGIDARVIIRQAVKSDLASGHYDNEMKARYAGGQRNVRRS